jgi:polyhydroxybutyrate depolymerase
LPLDVTKGCFNDIVPLKHYYDAAAIIMGCLGAIKGTSETTFSPEQNLTREQLAVIIMRTLRLGADNTNAYKSYKDYASIAGWATEAVSACLNATFSWDFTTARISCQQTAVTRAEICKLIYTISQPSHTIKIGNMTGGTVTASRRARPWRARSSR